MTAANWVQLLVIVALIFAFTPPLGIYIAAVALLGIPALIGPSLALDRKEVAVVVAVGLVLGGLVASGEAQLPRWIVFFGGLSVSALVAVDGIGCAFESLTYKTDKLANSTVKDLKKLSDALTAKLNYLMEPISAVELDADSCTVQCRSNPPQQGEDGRSYYELLVRRGGDILLCRYLKQPGQPRQVVPAQVTREVLARLGEDFVATVG